MPTNIRVDNIHHEIACSIAGKFYSDIDQAINETLKDGEKRSFAICFDGERAYTTKAVTGWKIPKCPKGEKIGSVRTQLANGEPFRKEEWEFRILANTFKDREEVTCLGEGDYAFLKDEAGRVARAPVVGISCMSIDTKHSQYENFRKDIVNLYEELQEQRRKMDRALTAEELEKGADRIETLMRELARLVDDVEAAGLIQRDCEFLGEYDGIVQRIKGEDAEEVVSAQGLS